jgi:hypothetical protein
MELSLIRDLIGDQNSYEKFIETENDDECLEYETPRRSDSRAIKIIKNQLGLDSGTEIQKFEKAERDNAIRLLKNQGLGDRQLERLTGINRKIIHKI